MHDIILFKNLRTRKREACVFRNLHSGDLIVKPAFLVSKNAVYLEGTLKQRKKSTFSVILSGYLWTGTQVIPRGEISRRMNWFLHRVQFKKKKVKGMFIVERALS